jgi:hypothetical protein
LSSEDASSTVWAFLVTLTPSRPASGERIPATLENIRDKRTLAIYSMMYGPQRKAPCPMCTSFLNAWNGIAVAER